MRRGRVVGVREEKRGSKRMNIINIYYVNVINVTIQCIIMYN